MTISIEYFNMYTTYLCDFYIESFLKNCYWYEMMYSIKNTSLSYYNIMTHSQLPGYQK